MEWLINRRRMMFNTVRSPEYLTFEDTEAWRICCENWGDYNETVITDNGNNTVDIVVTFKSMLNNVVKKSNVISTQTDVDNSGGMYVEGTTKQAVGITMKQCQAVTSMGSNSSVFSDNTVIQKFNELAYFTGLTAYATGHFEYCTSLSELTLLPLDIKKVNVYRGCTSLSSLIVPEGVTTITGDYWIYQSGVTYVELPSTLTNGDRHLLGNLRNACVFVIKAIEPPTIARAFTQMNNSSVIYVPNDSVNAYKAADKWSAIASKIYSINDYNPA